MNSREIEFRGKGVYALYVNVKTGREQLQWCHGTLRYIYEKGKNTEQHRTDKAIIDSRFGENEVLYSTLGQFTGLKDRNGVKIYEGDIIRYYVIEECENLPGVDEYVWKIEEYIDYVVFEDGRFTLSDECSIDLRILCNDCRMHDKTLKEDYGYVINQDEFPMIKTMDDTMFAEVIGNIYDNPELIVDKQESVCPEFMEYLKGIEKSERLKEKYGFAPYEDVYEEYCRLCKHYNMDAPAFEEWVPREEYRREVLCKTDEKYANCKFVSYKDYKKD